MRATVAAGRPGATSSRERATRCLTPIPARVPRDLKLHRLAPQGALEAGVALTQLVELGGSALPASFSAPAAMNYSRHRASSVSEMSRSRASSVIVLWPFSAASTSQVFCIHEEILRSLFPALRTGASDGCAPSRAGRNYRGDRRRSRAAAREHGNRGRGGCGASCGHPVRRSRKEASSPRSCPSTAARIRARAALSDG